MLTLLTMPLHNSHPSEDMQTYTKDNDACLVVSGDVIYCDEPERLVGIGPVVTFLNSMEMDWNTMPLRLEKEFGLAVLQRCVNVARRGCRLSR